MQDYENIEYDEFDKGLADDLKDAILLEDRKQLLNAMTKAGIKSFVDETGKKWIRFGEQWFFVLEPEKKKSKINS